MAQWRDPVRAAARRLYVQGSDTVDEIAEKLGISSSTTYRWAREEGWPRRSKGAGGSRRRRRAAAVLGLTVSREDLIPRLYAAIARNLTRLENRMTNNEAASGGGDERDTRAIGTLARTLEKVTELEAGTDHTTAAAPKSGTATAKPDLDEAERLRLELADRILKLRERGKP